MFCVLGVRLVALQITEGPAYAVTGLTTRLDRVELPQSAFDCVVGDLGTGPTLYVAVNDFGGDPSAGPAGMILAVVLHLAHRLFR